MISFIWTPSGAWSTPFPLIPGAGGSETVTVGYARELTRRKIANQIVTFRLGDEDGRKLAPDVRFTAFEKPADVRQLEGPVLFVLEPLDIDTVEPAFMQLWLPPYRNVARQQYEQGFAGRRLITQTRAMTRLWSSYLDIDPASIGLVPAFAEPVFGRQPVPPREDGPTRVLFAGRLTATKGIYTLLEALHYFHDDPNFEFTVVLAGSRDTEFSIIERLLEAHPMLTTTPPRRTAESMAELLVTQDVLVMPTHGALFPEPFGVLSVEAQHAGCRVVASNLGGLPETDCGGLHLFEPDDPYAFSLAIRAAAERGRLSASERATAAAMFTVQQSTDRLCEVLEGDTPVYTPA